MNFLSIQSIGFLVLAICWHQTVLAVDDISLPDRIRQDQRLKELNQQLEDQFTQLSPKDNAKMYQILKL